MLTSFATELGNFLGRRFVFSAFFLGLIFWGVGLATWLIDHGLWVTIRQWNGLPTEIKVVLGFAFLAGVTLFAYILHNLQWLITRFYEGYWGQVPLLFHLGEKKRQKKKRQRQNLQQEIDNLLEQLNQGNGDIDQIHSRLQELYYQLATFFPSEERAVMPTRLGNILKASELYPYQRYKLNAVLLWPRLYGLLPQEFLALLEDAQLAMNVMLRLTTLAFLFGLFWTPYWLYQGQTWLSVFCALGFLLAWVFYQSALSPARSYGELTKVAFDLYRWNLLTALHWPLPQTPQDEEKTWIALGNFIYAGFRPEITYITPVSETIK
jgi:hypothetical protein